MATYENDQQGPGPAVPFGDLSGDRRPDGGDGQADAGRTHLSAAGLRARGWTTGMVRRLLGEPDLLRPHPLIRSAPRTRLYRVDRVEAAERGEEFRAASAAAARRSAAARAAALRRRREMLARIAAEPLDVPRLAPDRLAALAVEHRRRRDGRPRRGRAADPTAADGTGSAALERWMVDYLCHRLTRCTEILDELYGSTGRAAAEELLRRRVYAAISEAYPNLAQECERQLRERECGPPRG